MEKNLAMILMGICLILGIVGGAVFAPKQVETETIVETELVEVPVNVTEFIEVEVKVFENSIVLDKALDEFLEEVDDDDDLLVCNDHEYDFDEVSVAKLYDDYVLSVDGDDSTVEFKVKLKYDEDDEKSCKESFDVLVEYFEDEDTEVSVLD